MNELPSILTKKIIFKKFKLGKLINTSPFGWVYEGKNLVKNIPVAIKIEKTSNNNLLESEAYILMDIKGFGIPEIISFGKYGNFKILIEELLGKSIQILWNSCPYKKDPLGKNNIFMKDICLLAIQGIERLKYIHSKNVIHRDIKPQNFLIGRNNPNDIYLIDFGLAKKYRSSRTGKHIRFSKLNYLIGSIAFSSHNAIKGYESSRRDDLESFCYMLIYLAKCGVTPWKELQYLEDKNEAMKYIIKMKLEITDKNLCKGLPNEFIHYLKYVRKLDFEQEPDYQYLIGLFTSMLSKNEMKKNLTFFWIKENDLKQDKQILDINKNLKGILVLNKITSNNSRSNSLNRLYNKIKESLNKNSVEKNNSNINYSANNTIIVNNEKKDTINQRFKIKRNNCLIKSILNNNNIKHQIKAITDRGLSNQNKNRVYSKFCQTLNINNNKINKEINSNNNKSLFQYHKLNKRKINNLLKPMNLTINNNKNNVLYNNLSYNNIYFIEGNLRNIKNVIITNNSRLNIRNNKKSLIYS